VPPARPLRLAPEWDSRYARMVVVSAAAHMMIVAAIIVLAPYARLRPLPMMAYTVELTDARALGGRLPPGPPTGELGGPQKSAAPEPKGQPAPEPQPPPKAAEPEPPPKPPEQVAKAEAPPVTIPEKPPEPKPESKPEPKPEPKPKPEAKPPEPPKPAPAARPPEPPAPRAEAKPAAKAPATKPPAAGAKPGSPAGREESPRRDAYAAAAERWRSRAGGLGGTDTGSGPIGAGGEGKGGGGQLVGLDFMVYRQAVITTIKAQWTNVFARPGLVAKVRFEIAPDGAVSDVRLEQSSGNSAYDLSAVRAVQHANPLPPPPARYASEFHEFLIEFRSEETGGQGAG